MKDKIIKLIEKLEKNHDFEDEFYVAYTSGEDISDWHNSHFEDNVQLGCSVGQTMTAEEIIAELKGIIEENN